MLFSMTGQEKGDCLIEVDCMGRFDCIVCLLDGV